MTPLSHPDGRLRDLTRYHFQDADAFGPTPDGYFKVADVEALLAAVPVEEAAHCENCGAIGVALEELLCRSCWEQEPEGPRFHWRDGVYFQRVDQGAVLITLPQLWKVIPASEWVSIVTHLASPGPVAGAVRDVDFENQHRQLEALGLLGEFAPSCDIADALGSALLEARAKVDWNDCDRDQTVPAPQWQPIETAPKDRGFLLAYNTDRQVHGLVCWWPGGGWNGEGCWGWDKENIAWSRQRGNQPTHWMPLPSPPRSEQDETQVKA